jgi:hypothetical protein
LAVSSPISLGGDNFKVTFMLPATAQHFYFLTVSLD